ncbi:hypothetical protein K1719_035705 [Acacia pycnantha]|nr:hypothetical protein K1719_035705 [Acacia pycnantha]
MKAEYPPKFQYLQFLGASINCVVISWLRRSATWLSLRLQSLHLEWVSLSIFSILTVPISSSIDKNFDS